MFLKRRMLQLRSQVMKNQNQLRVTKTVEDETPFTDSVCLDGNPVMY